MYEEGFDVEAVKKRLRNTFVIESELPQILSAMLARLHGAEARPMTASVSG